MRRFTTAVLILSASAGTAYAQRGGGDWTTEGNDAQRSSWVRADPKINRDSIQKPDFKFLWKVPTASQPSSAITLNSYIGYRGFRALAFVVGTADNITAIDTDLGRIEWQKSYGGGAPVAGGAGCPGGTTAGLARPTITAFPGATPAGRGGGGRGTAAKSAVGDPGDGAVTIKEIAARAAAAPPMPPAAGRGGRGRGAATPGAPGGYNPFARGPAYVYLLSADGMLHSLYLSNGVEPNPPVKFLPPNANARGLTVVENVAYAATVHGCGGVSDQIWALDLESKEVTTWKAASGGIVGADGPAFGPDGTLYVATGDGVLMSLEPKTLKPKEAYNAGAPFTSSPVIFQHKDKTLIAAASKDGNIQLVDAAAPSAALAKAPGSASALSTWQDASGTRWLLGTTAHGIAAWKVADAGAAPTLEAGWTSREMVAPLKPMVINGVVFAASGGDSRHSRGDLRARWRERQRTVVERQGDDVVRPGRRGTLGR